MSHYSVERSARDPVGLTSMPELPGDWVVTAETFRPADARNPYDLTFRTLARRS